jgi:hypothetical protein
MESPRQCFFIPIEQFDDNGYIPSLVTEGQPGHAPMTGNGTHASPWYWGKTYEAACEMADKQNEAMGIDKKTAAEILVSSMAASR